MPLRGRGPKSLTVLTGSRVARDKHPRRILTLCKRRIAQFDQCPGACTPVSSRGATVPFWSRHAFPFFTEALLMFLTSLSGLAAIFAVAIVYFHWFAIAAGALLLFLAFLFHYYRTTARELKRLESVFRSAVFVCFIEGVKGASTIHIGPGWRVWTQVAPCVGRRKRCDLRYVRCPAMARYPAGYCRDPSGGGYGDPRARGSL